jgi:hypothetical protein
MRMDLQWPGLDECGWIERLVDCKLKNADGLRGRLNWKAFEISHIH